MANLAPRMANLEAKTVNLVPKIADFAFLISNLAPKMAILEASWGFLGCIGREPCFEALEVD